MKPDPTTAIAAPISVEVDPPESFTVDDAASANWVIRKIIEARAYAKHVKAWADGELIRAQREEEFFLCRYGQQLERWARAQIDNSHRKSIKLPAGTLGFRTEPTKLDVRDELRLIAWCRKTLPAALRIETHILKQIIKDHVTDTGECPDGAEIVVGQQRFYVK
jgi:hypothetical protein